MLYKYIALFLQDISWFDDQKNSVGALTAALATETGYVKGVQSYSHPASET